MCLHKSCWLRRLSFCAAMRLALPMVLQLAAHVCATSDSGWANWQSDHVGWNSGYGRHWQRQGWDRRGWFDCCGAPGAELWSWSAESWQVPPRNHSGKARWGRERPNRRQTAQSSDEDGNASEWPSSAQTHPKRFEPGLQPQWLIVLVVGSCGFVPVLRRAQC